MGDAAAVTVPKLGSLGHREAEIVADGLARELGATDEEPEEMTFEVVCMGDMGGHRGFCMHTDEWWGGNTSILKIGYTPHMLKMGFKEMYCSLGARYRAGGCRCRSSWRTGAPSEL